MLQGVLGVFLREPVADWQREARLVGGAAADEGHYIGLKVHTSSSGLLSMCRKGNRGL